MLVIIKPTNRLEERQERLDAGMLAEECGLRCGTVSYPLSY